MSAMPTVGATPEPGMSARAHHLRAAAVTVVAAGLVAGLPEALGDLGRLAAVLVVQLGLVLAWVLVTGVQGFAGALTVGAAAAVAADLMLVLPEDPSIGELRAVLGLGFLAVVLQQMVRRTRRDLVLSMSGVVLLVVLICALAALLLLGRGSSGSGWAVVTLLAVGAALVVGHLVDLVLPRPELAPGVPRGLAGLVLAVLAAAAVAFLAHGLAAGLDALEAALVGAVLGGVAALTALAASYVAVDATRVREDAEPDDTGRFSSWALPVVQVAVPLAACAPVALALQSVL